MTKVERSLTLELKRPNLEAILAEVRIRLDDQSSLLRSPHDMVRYDINRALQDYFPPLFDAVHEHTASFRSLSSSQVETHSKTLCESASSIISSLDQQLSSPAAVSRLG